MRFRGDMLAREHLARERPASALEQAHAAQLGRNFYAQEERQEARLAREGAAGQEAGIPGMQPEPALQHMPGGALLEGIQHPAFTTVEHLFRVLPNDSWTSIDRAPDNPVVFELGAVTVPSGMVVMVTDYVFTALRQSGVDPYDFVAAEPYRFSGYMGFFLTVGGRIPNDLFYQLDPAPQQFQRQSYDAPVGGGPGFGPAQQRNFNVAAANSFGNVGGAGNSLLPVRPNVQGPRGQPFTIVAQAGDKIALSCVIFRRVMAPLAGIQGSVSGYKIHQQAFYPLQNRTRPR